MRRNGIALWPLPFVAGLLPVAATLIAFWLSASAQLIPACNPLVEGCVSISRAARHGLGNHVFRALVLPGAFLQAITWAFCALWFRQLGVRGPSLTWLTVLGAIAGVFFIVYGTFLGTEGETYRWLRRYGVVVYFGFTWLCAAILAGQLGILRNRGVFVAPLKLDRVVVLLLLATLGCGIANRFVAPLFSSETMHDRFENLCEWYAAAGLTACFMALAWLWKSSGFRARTALPGSPGE
ncbi:MAG: hypothetical protein ACKVP2_11185 [Burkholderiales bacterium]